MDCKYPKYPHWYCPDEKKMICDDDMMDDMCFNPPMPCSMPCAETLKQRLLGLIGDRIIFSVDARLCRSKGTLCGILSYVGCDFIIVSLCLHRKALSLHVPIDMLRYVSPY